MTYRASDLPAGVKRDLLGKIRGQVGNADYGRLVSGLGEDGLLNAVLSKTSGGASSPPNSASSPAETAATWVSFLALAVIYFVIRCLHRLVGVALGLAVLERAGNGLWKAITFTAGGTVTWFQWLLGHL